MLIDMISPDEKKIIEILRHNVGDEENDFFRGEYASTEYFLRFWEVAKQNIADAFGGKLILKKRVSSVIEDDQLYENMRKLMWTPEYENVKTRIMNRLCDYNERDWDYGQFPFPTGSYKSNMRHAFRDYVFNTESWVNNKYEGPTMEVKLPNGQVFKMIYGCKVMKALGRIIKSFNDQRLSSDFENLRLKQSQIMNEANIQANLCISIHPLDYMTASYNENDWRSCMCWEDGEFRRGVVEMMNSPMVIVAYIESNSNNMSWWNGCDNPRLEWNSKRWREFFIVNEDMISGIKGYPYWNRFLEDETLKWLREIFVAHEQIDYCKDIDIFHFPDSWADMRTVKNDHVDVLLSFDCGPAMYNDFYGGNDYHMIFRNGLSGEIDTFYSGESECVCCGSVAHDFDGEGCLICSDCIRYYSCCKCGESISREEDLIEFNGRYYCHYCYEQLDICSYCDEPMDSDIDDYSFEFVIGRDSETTTDVIRIKPNNEGLFGTDKPPIEVFHVCEHCVNKVFKNVDKLYHTPMKTYSDWYHYHMIIPIDELTEEGLKIIPPEDLEYFLSHENGKTLSA